MVRPRLALDPAQPEVQNHQTLASNATDPKIIAACAHYGLPCDEKNLPLARARLSLQFMGAAQPEGEPQWLKDLSSLFRREMWKVTATRNKWAETYFGKRWVPVRTASQIIVMATKMILEDNDITFHYTGPQVSRRPPAPSEKPRFNVINRFSDLLREDLTADPVMKKTAYARSLKTDWIEKNYTAPALADLGVKPGDALYFQEESRLRHAFNPTMVQRKDHLWITQQLDREHIKLTGTKKSGKTARLMPWGVVVAGPGVSTSVDFLVAFLVSKSITQAALGKGKDRHRGNAPAPSRAPRTTGRGSKRQRLPQRQDDDDDDEDEEPRRPARRRRRVSDNCGDDNIGNDDEPRPPVKQHQRRGDDDKFIDDDNNSGSGDDYNDEDHCGDDEDESPRPPTRRHQRRSDGDNCGGEDEDEEDEEDEEPRPPTRRRRRRGDDEPPAGPLTLVDAFLETYQVRQFLADPNPSKSRPVISGSRRGMSAYDIKELLTGPCDSKLRNFVYRRCTGYGADFPLGLRYRRDCGPPFDPNEHAGRPHPAAVTDLSVKQTKAEKDKLRGPLPCPD